MTALGETNPLLCQTILARSTILALSDVLTIPTFQVLEQLFPKMRIAVLEVKSACMRSVADMRKTLDEKVFRLAAYTAAAQDLDPKTAMVGVLVGVVIHKLDQFHVLLIEVTV